MMYCYAQIKSTNLSSTGLQNLSLRNEVCVNFFYEFSFPFRANLPTLLGVEALATQFQIIHYELSFPFQRKSSHFIRCRSPGYLG